MAAVFGYDSTVFFGWAIVVLLLILIILVSTHLNKCSLIKSPFANDPNNIRKYQLVGDQSQSDRQAAAIMNVQKSGLTGSRDVPVFFQDYDYDMTLSKTGLSTSREGLADNSVDEKLKKLGA